MGKVVEKKKKKKKGRPSLLDLQKRNLKQQQQQKEQQQHREFPHPNLPLKRNSNPNPRISPVGPTPTRRSARRNPNSGAEDPPDDADEDEDEDSPRGRREKKLKFVLKLPSLRNSPSLNSVSCASDSNAEDETPALNHHKRKINDVGGGSAYGSTEKRENLVSCTNATSHQQGTQLDSEPSTPLPNKKLLRFILERLQKKDTYGVFSEPVDPKELPDYHDIIDHPMDFGTVTQKLDSGSYANLEQFEKDVFLICLNAMQYNSPDTIYFRQARTIQELAKKDFENLRQDSDDSEPEPKIVRRGRPPTKNLKKPLGRPPLERAGSEFSSDATPATGGEGSVRSHYDLRKGPFSDKNGPADSSEQVFHGSRRTEAYARSLADQKSERNEEFTGSLLKGHAVKHGKKQFVLDENRRNTYKQFHPSAGGQEPSVLSTFDGERKQLMAVGLLTEFGYARSLARFAATLGPAAWKIASNKIERSLPSGLKFGPGWVGEEEAAPHIMPPLHPLPLREKSNSTATPSTAELKGNEPSLGKTEVDKSLETCFPSPVPALDSASIPSTFIATDRCPELGTESEEALRESNSYTRFQIHPGMNGFNGTYGVNFPSQMGKFAGEKMPDMISRTNSNFLHPATAKINSSTPLQDLGREGLDAEKTRHHPQASWPQQRVDLVPPDLNVMFQSHERSPSSSRVDLTQPDLALQL